MLPKTDKAPNQLQMGLDPNDTRDRIAIAAQLSHANKEGHRIASIVQDAATATL